MPSVMDVIIEESDMDAENIGITDDFIQQKFPFSAAVPAVLEARNKQQAAFIDQKGNLENFCSYFTFNTILALCL